MDHAETCEFGVNDSRTDENIDTPLTQARSSPVHSFEDTRRDLIALAVKHERIPQSATKPTAWSR
jgi:hypothetical protein